MKAYNKQEVDSIFSNWQDDLDQLDVIEVIPSSVLDKIRAEVEKQEKWLFLAGLTTYNVDIAFSSIKAVLKESKE